MADGAVRDQLQEAAAEVLAQEEEHHSWALLTRADLVTQLVAAGRDDRELLDLSEMTRADLYEQAQAIDLEGRSQMNKEELADALAARTGHGAGVGGDR
jgi:hypothetical protein